MARPADRCWRTRLQLSQTLPVTHGKRAQSQSQGNRESLARGCERRVASLARSQAAARATRAVRPRFEVVPVTNGALVTRAAACGGQERMGQGRIRLTRLRLLLLLLLLGFTATAVAAGCATTATALTAALAAAAAAPTTGRGPSHGSPAAGGVLVGPGAPPVPTQAARKPKLRKIRGCPSELARRS